MLRTILLLLVGLPALALSAAPSPEGRWEGLARIPGRDMPLVVDLAPDKTGDWTGSIIVPGLGIKGARLSKIVVTDAGVAFDIDSALADPTFGPAAFSARVDATGMEGEMRQAGNAARLSLVRIGPAQVETLPRSTPVARDVEDQWNGQFELGGYPRYVTLTFENHADAGATAKFVLVGKQTYDLPVDLVIQDNDFLRIESQANRITFEGRFFKDSAEIRGTIEIGPNESSLVLQRGPRRAS